MEITVGQGQFTKILAKAVATLSSIAGAFWAVITYVFPDPTVLGLGVVNWKNLLSFCAAFVFMGAILVALLSRRLPIYLRAVIHLILAAGISASFFVIGMEYAKPSFDFAKQQQESIENDSPTLMGGRVEMIDNVRISLGGCRVIAQVPSCTFEITSTNRDRNIGFNSETSFFEPGGSALNIERVVVGSRSENHLSNIALVRNLTTKITLVFQPTRESITTIPSIRLVIDGLENSRQVIKFNEVAAR